MPNLTSQMEAVCRRFEELSIRLNQPETAADPAQFRRLMQEYHEAQPVVDAYHALTTAQDHLAQAKALLEGDEPLDADFKAMVQQELSEKSQDVAELENNLKILLLPKDANDEKSVIMEIRAGADGLRYLRFPGGSTNTVSRRYGGRGLMQQLKEEVTAKGYAYVDWNVCAEDAVGGKPSAGTIFRNIVRETGEQTQCIVLMHDSATTRTTAEALPDIIQWYKDNGFAFLTVEQAVPLPTT